MLVVVLASVLGGFLLALVVRPYHSDFGGGDPENYLFNGVRQARGGDPSYRFLPPEWDRLPTEEQDALRATFLDEEARMYRLEDLPRGAVSGTPTVDPVIARKKAVVDEENQIRIAHDNLYSVVLAAAVLVHQDEAPYLLNSIFAVAAGIVFGALARAFTGSRSAWLVGGLLVVLPASVFGVLETRTEAFATLLLVLFAWLTVRDQGRTAWPGLVLVALWMTRHEFMVPLLIYLVWAVVRRRRGSGWVVGATVAAAYLFAWGPAGPGDLFPDDRDLFAVFPDVGAWILVPAFGALWAAAGRLEPLVERAAGRLAALGRDGRVHRAVWGALVAGALVAELVRRQLEAGERGFLLFRGSALSTTQSLLDTAGWPIVLLGVAGLVVLGPRLAGRAPWVLALVLAPQAMVLIRTGTSGNDLWNVARRFGIALYPVLLIGVALVLAEIVGRLRPEARGRVVAAGVVGICVLGLLGPFDRLPPRGEEPDRDDARAFHEAADRLPADALVVLDHSYGSMSAQPALRFFHGQWSFVAWDRDELDRVLPVALAAAERPVLVEESLVDLVQGCGGEVADTSVALPVEHGLSEGELVRLVLVEQAGVCGSDDR